jgi:hypothetical protein
MRWAGHLLVPLEIVPPVPLVMCINCQEYAVVMGNAGVTPERAFGMAHPRTGLDVFRGGMGLPQYNNQLWVLD